MEHFHVIFVYESNFLWKFDNTILKINFKALKCLLNYDPKLCSFKKLIFLLELFLIAFLTCCQRVCQNAYYRDFLLIWVPRSSLQTYCSFTLHQDSSEHSTTSTDFDKKHFKRKGLLWDSQKLTLEFFLQIFTKIIALLKIKFSLI